MFEVKSIQLEQKISNENEIKLLFDTESTFPCLFPLLFSLRVIRFQSLSTQYSDLMALKDWYIFWYKKYSISFCEFFYSSNYNFELVYDEIDSFIIYLENNNDISDVTYLGGNRKVSYINISNKIRSFLKFYTYLMDDYLTVKKHPHLDRKEIEKIKLNIKKHIDIKKKILRKSTKTIHGEKKYLFKSMTNEMVKVLYETIAPSSSDNTNAFNPFKNRPTQFRNFLIIHLMLNYGLRVGELMLLTVNSIKKSILNDSYSLIITNTDDEHDDRRRKPKIKNEFSYRVITLQERDYRFINIYIKEIRSDINSDILFTSLKPPYSSLSYSSVNKIFTILDKKIKHRIPHHFDNKAFDSINGITPHVCRHTWAYLMLNYSFKKYENMDKLGNSINNIGQNSLNKAQDDLRVLGGWSPASLMPIYYGKRFLVERANISNLERIIEMSAIFEKTLKKQLDIEFESSVNEKFFNIFSSEDLNSIDNLKIPPILKFNLASKFDTKFIGTKHDIWEFFYSGNKIHLNFDCFDFYEKKILKFFLVFFVQVNTPSRLNSKLDSFKYAIRYFKNNKLNFNFDSFKILLNHLSKTDKNHFYYDLKFLVKLLFLENFSGFNIDKEYELDFLERPKSFNSELYYQEYEDRIDYPLKTMIHQGFSKINSDLLLHGENIANEQLLNSAMLALVYVSGLRPVQLAKLSVSDLKQDTIRKSDNFCRYSILIPYAKQSRYVHEKIAIKLPEEIASILIAYIKRYSLNGDQKMFDMGDNASRFCQHSINKQLFEFSPKQYKEAVLSGEMIQQKYSYSDFRHHVGYSLAISGASAEEIAYILGHSSVVTARHYIFSTPEMAQIRAKALGRNSLYKQMIAMLLTGQLVYTKDWSSKKVLGNIGADIHYDIGGCSYPGHCLFQPVRNCYGCMYFHPFIDADHGKVLDSIQNEINLLIKLSDGIGLSRNPVIRIHETTKFEIESVILRCNVSKESDRDF